MEQAVNTFQKGLNTDSHPMAQSNDRLTDALNATFVTMNGNEIILLNDMGNRRIDNAFLPSGYLPVGMKEYGGIIYVAAYNPITNKSQIGSFPSPERKITLDNFDYELENNLIEYFANTTTKFVNSDSVLIPLTLKGNESISLHPGDKFVIYTTDNSISNLENLLSNYNNTIGDKVYSPKNKLFTMSVGVINSLNEFVDITSSLVRWKNNKIVDLSEKSESYIFNYGYFIPNLEDKSTLTIDDNNFRLNRMIVKDTNTYSYKLVGPLYLKIHLNHIEKFNYTISGVKSEGKLESLTIKGQVEYNCPDGVDPSVPEPSSYLFNSYSGNNSIYKYEASLHEGKQLDNTSFLDFYKKGDSNSAKGYKDNLEIFTKISYNIKYSNEIKNEIDNIIGESYKKKLDKINFYTEPSDIILISKEYDTINKKWKLDILSLQIGSTVLTGEYNGKTSTMIINVLNPSSLQDTSETETISEDITKIDWISLDDVEKYIYSSIYNESTNLYRVNFRYKYKISLNLPENNLWPYKIDVRANIKDEASNYYLSEFSTKGILNLDLINSNTIKVIQWRFFNNVENKLTDLSYYLECYPEEDIEFKNLKIKFTRINLDGTDGKTFTREIPGLVQTGLNHISLPWNDDFEERALYKVTLSCDNKSENIVDDYWFLTTELFNDCYYLGKKYVNNYCKPESIDEQATINELLTIKLNFNTKETILSDTSQFPKLITKEPSPDNTILYTRTVKLNVRVDLSNLISDLYPDCIYQKKSIPTKIEEISPQLAPGRESDFNALITQSEISGGNATNNDGSSSSSGSSDSSTSGNTEKGEQISQTFNSQDFELTLTEKVETTFTSGDLVKYTCGFDCIKTKNELKNIVDPYTQIGIGFLNRSGNGRNSHRLNLKYLSTRWNEEKAANWSRGTENNHAFTDEELDFVAKDSPHTFMLKNYIDDIASMTDVSKVWLAGFGSCNYPSADKPSVTYHGLFVVGATSKELKTRNSKTTSRLWLRGVNGELALVDLNITKAESVEPNSDLIADKVFDLIKKYYYYTNESGNLSGFQVSNIFDSHQLKTAELKYTVSCNNNIDIEKDYIVNKSELFKINANTKKQIFSFSIDNQPFIDYLLNYNIYNIRNIDLTTGYMTDIEGNPLNINYVYVKEEGDYLKRVDIPMRYSTEIKCGDKNSLMFFGNTSNKPIKYRYDNTHADEDHSKTYLDYAGINVIDLSS